MSDFEGAIRHFRRSLACDPLNITAHAGLAESLHNMKDREGAAKHLDTALRLAKDKLSNKSAEIQLILGRLILIISYDLDKSLLYLQSAVELEPMNPKCYRYLGQTYAAWKDYDKAIADFRKSLQLDPNQPKVHTNLGAALFLKNDLDGAIKHYHKALVLDPNFAGTHYNLGNALKMKNDLDGAIRHYSKALDLDPSYADAHINLGNALVNKKDLDGAIMHYRKALDLNPSFALAYNNLGAALRMKKAFASAFHLWNHVFLKNPVLTDNPEAGNRFRAARDAVLATGSLDQDADRITEADRLAMRMQAYAWLQADLNAWSTHFKKERVDTVMVVANALLQWQTSPDLAGVRDDQNLVKLPEDERKSWQKLWADVEQLRKQTGSAFEETTRLSGVVTTKERAPVHEVKLQAGTTYVIDLESSAFDTFLRLEDAQGKKLAENDDIEPGQITDSRLIFNPKTDGLYRLVASAFDQSGIGPYTLTIREFVK